MCGIVGYVGNKLSKEHILRGLSRLEYRGYDSAGFSCISAIDGQILCAKASGHLDNLEQAIAATPIDGHIGIGHIRWSSHGAVSHHNAHPHFDCQRTVSLVHNGIIENDYFLRKELQAKEHIFVSQTDTEVVAHLLEDILTQESSLVKALLILVNQLEGAYAIACITQNFPDQFIIIRKGSPLCIGFGNQEIFIGSDQIAFAEYVQDVMFVPEKSFGIISAGSVLLYNFEGEPLAVERTPLDKNLAQWLSNGKNGFAHFMLKEIYEQKGAIQKTLQQYQDKSSMVWQQLGITQETIATLDSLTLIGSGTSWHAACVAKFFFELVTKIPITVELASEFRYTPFFAEKNSLYMIVSQSGETADTLESLRMIQSNNVQTIALTNVISSAAVRESDGFILTHAGQEVAVASTKTFSCQIAVLFWLSHAFALEKNLITAAQMKQSEANLLIAAEVLENSIEKYKKIIVDRLAPFYSNYKKFIFLGRHIGYPFAMEAALKLKEISYLFAQSYPAGELKHGSLALIDEYIAVVVFSSLNPLIYQKLLSNVQEVKARNGHIVVFAFFGQEELISLADTVFIIDRVHELLAPVALVGLMQFFIYQIAKELNCAIDKPRNLAKTLTIE